LRLNNVSGRQRTPLEQFCNKSADGGSYGKDIARYCRHCYSDECCFNGLGSSQLGLVDGFCRGQFIAIRFHELVSDDVDFAEDGDEEPGELLFLKMFL